MVKKKAAGKKAPAIKKKAPAADAGGLVRCEFNGGTFGYFTRERCKELGGTPKKTVVTKKSVKVVKEFAALADSGGLVKCDFGDGTSGYLTRERCIACGGTPG